MHSSGGQVNWICRFVRPHFLVAQCSNGGALSPATVPRKSPSITTYMFLELSEGFRFGSLPLRRAAYSKVKVKMGGGAKSSEGFVTASFHGTGKLIYVCKRKLSRGLDQVESW